MGRSPNFSSAAVVRALESLAAFLHRIDLLALSNVCLMDSHPPARRPHKSPAHTVKDPRKGPQRLASRPSAFPPEGAAHSAAFSSFRQHPVAGRFPAPSASGRSTFPPEGAAHSGAASSFRQHPVAGGFRIPQASGRLAIQPGEPHILARIPEQSTPRCRFRRGPGAGAAGCRCRSRCGARILHFPENFAKPPHAAGTQSWRCLTRAGACTKVQAASR